MWLDLKSTEAENQPRKSVGVWSSVKNSENPQVILPSVMGKESMVQDLLGNVILAVLSPRECDLACALPELSSTWAFGTLTVAAAVD